ncbi:U-box domain-containing protein 16 [Daucus carota subsp. sativus]|uniref:RING-type E3 ubiquitin transferase n=2 Tax=Daucus carota subsp. sativus TaxID=79200 RepID=A0A175YJY2_DAUCS|nr:PREDICTED: U-box domain-containing protein 16 [Daucus carota subsp. sativus]
MMPVSPDAFPSRKRRPSAAAFVSPNLSGRRLLQSLLLLSQETSALRPLKTILNRNSSSILRKIKLIYVLLDELLREYSDSSFPASADLCLEELYIVLHRIKTLLEDCHSGSTLWLLMHHDSVSHTFHQLTNELSTLLDIFPVHDLNVSQDVDELVGLIRKQCNSAEQQAFVEPRDQDLKRQVLGLLNRIKREIVPDHSKLAEIFNKLELCDSASFNQEIQSLEDEVQNQGDENSKADVIALIGLARYAKCVLHGASTPRSSSSRRRRSMGELTFPADFRCPISLDLIRDPVVVSTGQTYDRNSINQWLESGHNTCPKTGQTLSHTDLIPNNALKSLIAMWCLQQRIPFEATEVNDKSKGVKIPNKAALEATRMTVSFLMNKLTVSQSAEMINRMVHELRALAKTDSDNRACIAEAGGLPLLVKFLGSDHPNLQVNAVTTILNLSILEANKVLIMETDGVLNGVIEVLRSGATWEAKGNAAATIFSLTGVHAYRRKLGRKTRVVKGLIDLAKAGPTSSKKDALVAILNLAGDREVVGKLVEEGVVEMVGEIIDGLPEEVAAILELVVKKGGLAAVVAAYRVIGKLGKILREGSDMAQESAAATLVNICRKGGSDVVAELAGITGIERIVWELMGMGTGRCRRKAATLLRILRRWAAGVDHNGIATAAYSSSRSTNIANSTTIMLPS